MGRWQLIAGAWATSLPWTWTTMSYARCWSPLGCHIYSLWWSPPGSYTRALAWLRALIGCRGAL